MSDEQKPTLLPCPYCGSAAWFRSGKDDLGRAAAGCSSRIDVCPIHPFIDRYLPDEDVIRIWNTRSISPWLRFDTHGEPPEGDFLATYNRPSRSKKDRRRVGHAHRYKDSYAAYMGGGYGHFLERHHMTHWQPMPAPPVDDEEAEGGSP